MKIVSVIIPVYNAEASLERCVNSILVQSLNRIEVILVNDGSTDKSSNICDSYAHKDKRVRVIHTSNKGVSAARNKGLSQAKGEYVIFVDSDDYIEKQMLERLVTIAERECIDVVISGYNYIQFNGDIRVRRINLPAEIIIRKEEMRKLIFRKANQSFLWFVWNKLYKRSMLLNNNIKFNEELFIGEDSPFNMRAFLCAERVYYLDDTLYNYVQTYGSLTQTKYKEDLLEKLENLWKRKERFVKNMTFLDMNFLWLNILLIILFRCFYKMN